MLALANALLWRGYVAGAAAQGIAPRARRVLRAFSAPLHAAGHLAPIALAAAGWALPGAAGPLLALAGAAAIAAGAAWKFTVIVRASFTQGFELPRIPQRGSGQRAPPPRLGPDAAAPRPGN